jgi:uncharacterized protein YdhG (YjbR/CyaY superfamily)
VTEEATLMTSSKTTGTESRSTKTQTFSAEERAAMREAAKEAKAAKDRESLLQALLDRISEMDEVDRAIAERIHAIVGEVAPELNARTWYGMPAYALDDQIVCFIQPAGKFKARNATLGFQDSANLDDGSMWPTSFALTRLTKADEQRVAELIRRAVG